MSNQTSAPSIAGENNTEVLVVLNEIDKAIEYYREMKQKSNRIDELLQLYERLAGYTAFLRTWLGRYRECHRIAYAGRKIGTSQKMHELAQAALEAGKKPNASRGKAEGDFYTVDLLAAECRAEGFADRIHNVILGAQDVMNAIELRRNHYKSEREEERRSEQTIPNQQNKW